MLFWHAYIFFDEVAFKSFAHFLLDWLFSYHWNLRVFINCGYKSFVKYLVCNPVSQPVTCLFILFNGFFQAEVLNLDEVQIIHSFIFTDHILGIVSKKSFPNSKSQKLSLIFSSRSFIALSFIFRSYFLHLTHFELIFVRCELWVKVYFCIWMSNSSSTINLLFLLCQKLISVGLFLDF